MSNLHLIIGEDDYLVSETAKKVVGDGTGLEVVDSMNSTNAELQLKDRKGRMLTNGEIGHYRDIVFVLGETRRIMGEIKEVCASYG